MERKSWVVCALFLVVAAWGGLPAARAEENLLANPSFEEVKDNGTLKAWTLARNGTGKGSLERVAGGRIDEEGNAFHAEFRSGQDLTWVYIVQVVSREMKASEVYRYSAWLKASAPVEVDLVMYAIGKLPDDPAKSVDTHRRKKIKLTAEWQEFVLDDIAIDANGDYSSLRPQVQLYDKSATVMMDDAKIVRLE